MPPQITRNLCMSSPSPLHQLATQNILMSATNVNSEFFFSQPEYTIWVSRHTTLRTQYLHLGVLSLKAVYNSCKLHCLCTPLLTLSLSFQAPTYWNCHLPKPLLPDEVFQW